jgi:RNA-directed DNA polymerase
MLQALIAHSLSLTPSYIARLANTASHRYKHFTIPKANGGVRDIFHPARPLKAIQRWLRSEIISRFPVHNAAAAYRKGRSIGDHASIHLESRYLLRVDLASFFESITADDMAAYINDRADLLPSGWTDTDTHLFLQLVCMNQRLTIGAVTSPDLSNALCYRIDDILTKRCADRDVTYTRYADDMFFSTSTPNVLADVPALVEDTIKSVPYPASLRINVAKTRHSSLKRRRRITGVVLSCEGRLSLGRKFKRRVRSQIHRLDSLGPRDRARLAGLLAHVKDIEPAFFNRLVVKYGVKASAASRPPSQT